jgi:PAS domain S-box-containing protein
MITSMQGRSFRFDRALLSGHDPVVVYDRSWRFKYVNDGAAKFLRKSRAQLVRRYVWEVLPELVGTDYFAKLHQAVAEQCEMKFERRVDELGVWLEEHVHPCEDAVVVFATDITHRKMAEHEQNERLRRMEESVALAAHEIRGPLAPIRSATGTLRALSDGSAKMTQTIDILERQTQHISRLIDDLLDATRVNRDKIELQRTPACLSRLVAATVEEALYCAERRCITLSFAPCTEPLMVDVDTMRIMQVMRNLLTNACKYTDPGGRIEVRAYVIDDRAVVEIQDDGIGIPAENLESIFDMFWQAPEHRCRNREGLGVGLALARAILRLHEGTISAFSAGPGMGSRFIITLPLLLPGMESATSTFISCAESGLL